jgi:hypothetical protein
MTQHVQRKRAGNDFPKNHSQLGRRLMQLRPILRELGIHAERKRTKKGSVWTIWREDDMR